MAKMDLTYWSSFVNCHNTHMSLYQSICPAFPGMCVCVWEHLQLPASCSSWDFTSPTHTSVLTQQVWIPSREAGVQHPWVGCCWRCLPATNHVNPCHSAWWEGLLHLRSVPPTHRTARTEQTDCQNRHHDYVLDSAAMVTPSVYPNEIQSYQRGTVSLSALSAYYVIVCVYESDSGLMLRLCVLLGRLCSVCVWLTRSVKSTEGEGAHVENSIRTAVCDRQKDRPWVRGITQKTLLLSVPVPLTVTS